MQTESKSALSSNCEKTAVITGASSGIGLASVRILSKLGYTVLITARSIDRLNELAMQIKADGGVVKVYACDVSNPDEVTKLAQFAAENLKYVDVLFNNAGSGQALSLESTSDEIWQATIGVNLSGTFYCCREFLPLLKCGKNPLIINNASSAAHRGFPDFSAYSAAKGGIVSLSRALREELRPVGIRVTTLSAGATASPFWNNVEGEWDPARMMTCESIGQLVGHIAEMPACAQMEEVHLMPSGGAL